MFCTLLYYVVQQYIFQERFKLYRLFSDIYNIIFIFLFILMSSAGAQASCLQLLMQLEYRKNCKLVFN